MISHDLSPEILKELKETLSLCFSFEQDRQLQSMFVDNRISMWKDVLEDSFSQDQRINNLISVLVKRDDAQYQNALVQFLRVLSEQETGSLPLRLAQLADKIEDYLIARSNDAESEIRLSLELMNQIDLAPEDVGVQHDKWCDLKVLLSPFAYARTEENIRAAFVSNQPEWNHAFYGKTELFKSLGESKESKLIVGAPGTGKTALALGLFYYPASSYKAIFGNKMSELTLLAEVARLSFDDILSNPSMFHGLPRHQQEFLLFFLTTCLSGEALERMFQGKVKRLLSPSPGTKWKRQQDPRAMLLDYVRLGQQITHYFTQNRSAFSLDRRSVWNQVLLEILAITNIGHLKVILDVPAKANNSEPGAGQNDLAFLSTLCQQDRIALYLFLPEEKKKAFKDLGLSE